MENGSVLSKKGDRYHDFIVTKVQPIGELSCTLFELVHEPSNAQVMHIAAEDPENVFCLSFQTLPSSSNGVAHILEHTVLCGSRKFPVKDPFFAMLRRSLNTFMNAFTGADFTCYPAASLVEKDFYNLLEVYLDAVFHPKLSELSFLQEGHRLAFQKEDDPSSSLEIKGVVFNEMKGTMSSLESRVWHETLEHLMPDLPYAFNSGGDPKHIPQLTYADLIDFHETYYHPSHCLFFFYGNLPLHKHLDFIHEKILKHVLKQPPLPKIPLQKRFKEPKTLYSFYPVVESEEEGEEEQKEVIALSWLTAEIRDQEELLALCVLDSVLMDTDAAPLKRPLLESKLCTQVDAYIDTELTEAPYLLVFKGCEKKNFKALEELVFKTLSQIASGPIPEQLIDAALFQLELSRTEIGGDHSPFGLALFMRSALPKQHGCNPEYSLMVHSLFESLLRKMKDKAYFSSLIRKHFLDNRHMVKLVLSPKKGLIQEELQEEKEHLEKLKKTLTQAQIEKIITTSQELRKYQEMVEHQDLECLPKVSLDDVPKEARNFKLHTTLHQQLKVHHHESFTNHILYADIAFELPELSAEELQYLPLLISLIPELGAKERSYSENLEELQSHTGGIGVSCTFLSSIYHLDHIRPMVIFKGKTIERKKEKLFSLLCDTITSCRFDEKERIKELLLQIHTALHSRLTHNAMRYASLLALSRLSPAGYLSNLWQGIPYFEFINSLKKGLDKHLDALCEKLSCLYHKLFSLEGAHLIIASDQKCYESLKENDFFGLCSIPNKALKRFNQPLEYAPIPSQARLIASQVAFNVEAFSTVSYLHPHSPSILIASQLLENKILHRKIREQGGAYGCGAHYNSISSSFYFNSYRDPHIASTFATFEEALKHIAEGQFSEKDLEEAKLGIIQGIDSPLPPMSKALTAFTWDQEGKTHEIRQQYRDKLLSLSSEELKEAVKEALLANKEKSLCMSFTGKALLEKESQALKNLGKELVVFHL